MYNKYKWLPPRPLRFVKSTST